MRTQIYSEAGASEPMSKRILQWLAGGRRGRSSEAMALVALDVKIAPGTEADRTAHPYDPDDFNRCLILLKQAPEVRESFPQIATLSREWKALIARWDEIEKLFLEEAGYDWSRAKTAPRTYALMREILTDRSSVANASG